MADHLFKGHGLGTDGIEHHQTQADEDALHRRTDEERMQKTPPSGGEGSDQALLISLLYVLSAFADWYT